MVNLKTLEASSSSSLSLDSSIRSNSPIANIQMSKPSGNVNNANSTTTTTTNMAAVPGPNATSSSSSSGRPGGPAQNSQMNRAAHHNHHQGQHKTSNYHYYNPATTTAGAATAGAHNSAHPNSNNNNHHHHHHHSNNHQGGQRAIHPSHNHAARGHNPTAADNSTASAPADSIDFRLFESIEYPFCTDHSKYEHIAKIGQGTFGEVYKAKCKRTQEIVALKKVLTENEKEGFPITALREIKILQVLKHENVVRLIEICTTKASQANKYKSQFYLVFEFCEHDLAGLLSHSSVNFSLGERKKIMQQLLNGLYYIHKNGILHRDMKTANILVTKDGKLKLADFGLARAVVQSEQPTRYTNRVVTLWYRPPELLLGERCYNKAIDIWGSGCIMAELWTREPILKGNSEQNQLDLIGGLCGSITSEVWADVNKLELASKMILKPDLKRRIKERLGSYIKDPNGLDLLEKLLTLDPKKRIDSDEALDHDFFWTEPMPSDLKLDKLQSSMFEYTAQAMKKGQYRPQVKQIGNDQHYDRVY